MLESPHTHSSLGCFNGVCATFSPPPPALLPALNHTCSWFAVRPATPKRRRRDEMLNNNQAPRLNRRRKSLIRPDRQNASLGPGILQTPPRTPFLFPPHAHSHNDESLKPPRYVLVNQTTSTLAGMKCIWCMQIPPVHFSTRRQM